MGRFISENIRIIYNTMQHTEKNTGNAAADRLRKGIRFSGMEILIYGLRFL